MESDASETEEIKSQVQTEDNVSVKQVSDYLQKNSNSSKKSLDVEITGSTERIGITLEIISALLSSDSPLHVANNFIYFNGYNSGISTFSKKTFEKNPFAKSFCFSVWFRLDDLDYSTVDYAPLLFSFFRENVGGCECYFLQNQLYYRVLKDTYTSPDENSKGIFICEFLPEKWYYLCISHEKRFLGKPEVKVIVNGDSVISKSLEYPRMDKIDRFSHAFLAKHF